MVDNLSVPPSQMNASIELNSLDFFNISVRQLNNGVNFGVSFKIKFDKINYSSVLIKGFPQWKRFSRVVSKHGHSTFVWYWRK